MNAPDPIDHALHERWLRLGGHVRCALYPADATRVRLYVHCGMKLARSASDGGAGVLLRTLQTLLRTADDTTLPWFWRSVSIEHASLPYARLASLLGLHDPTALKAVESALARSRDALPALPPADAA